MSRPVAPALERMLEEPVKGVPMFAAYHGEVAVKELRALLAVARAGQKICAIGPEAWCENDWHRLARALSRLERARGGGR